MNSGNDSVLMTFAAFLPILVLFVLAVLMDAMTKRKTYWLEDLIFKLFYRSK